MRSKIKVSKSIKLLYFVFVFVVSFTFTYFLFGYIGDVGQSSVSSVNIFKPPTLIPSATPTPVSTKLLLTGDVMLGRKVMIASQDVFDPYYAFRKVAELLKQEDLVFINLENPVVDGCPRYESGFKFCTTPEIAKGLVYSGVDVVNLANNHIGNYGQTGIDETVNFLQDRGIMTTGLGNLVTRNINNTTFGFLGFDFTVKSPSVGNYRLISDSKDIVDVLLIAVHWGVEYTRDSTTQQRLWAKEMIDNGADIIVGHHPHWVQTMECVNLGSTVKSKLISLAEWEKDGCREGGKPVFYSLGNFIFDQMWSEETKKGVVIKLEFEENNIVRRRVMNTYIRNWGQVEVMEN